jgi:hypothetical protein
MHWLRELMRENPGRHRSLSAVARDALAHPSWPPDSRPQPRSLAALLSKLDRGLELDWLGDRPAVQQVLADVLGAPVSRIAGVVGEGVAQANRDQRRIRFVDLPYASPLDLGSEALPPGLPRQVLRPAEWNAVWWVAPRGSGRSLAGAWLSARSLASFVSEQSWEDAQAKLPESGAVLIELWGVAEPRAIMPPRPGICVAAPFKPSGESSAAWTIIESEPPSTWLEPLVHWLALRLPRDGGFEPGSALEWLRLADSEGLVDGLGSAIGLAGLMDGYGVKDVARHRIARTAERFVRERLTNAGRADGSDTAWFEKNGVSVLLGLAKRMMTSDDVASDAPRSEAAWIELVPEEYRHGVDAEWVRRSLLQALAPRTVRDVEKALNALPPGAFRVVRALSRAGILREEGHGPLLVLAPAWLARWANQQARRALVQGAPAEWGETLLSRNSAFIARGVVARALDGDSSVLEDVLDLENPREPAAMAAIELAFRAAGLALLAGVDVADDTRLALWDHTIAFLVERDDGPHPRIGYSGDADAKDPLLDVGIFRLAALAVSEALPPSRGKAHPLLRPWENAKERALLVPLLDAVWSAVSRFDWNETPWVMGAFDLAERLGASSARDSLADGDVHPLEWPAELLRRVNQRMLTWTAARTAGAGALSGAILLAARRGVASGEFIRSVWRAWLATPETLVDGSPLSPKSVHAEVLYGAAPPEALRVLFARGLVPASRVPYAVFDARQWRAVLEASPDALRGAREAFRAIPLEMALDALGRLTFGPEDVAEIWVRDRAVALDALADALALDAERALVLVAGAPKDAGPLILEKLLELRGLMPEALNHGAVRAWLYDYVARRANGFRAALELLDDAT